MGIFSPKTPAPTAADLPQHAHDSSQHDPEKANVGALIEDSTPTEALHHVDPELERRVVRKIDWRVPPLVSALFLLSFLDRGNIGNARIAGMTHDLNLYGERYDWLLTIFYISYILFQFQGFMWRIVDPHKWACFIVLAWGIVATCQAATQSWAGEMVLRFLLGAAEAGFGPSIPFLLSFFYLRHELGFRTGFFLSAAPLANSFAGALAYAIVSGSPRLAHWRLLFLVEGLPTIVMAFVAYFYLPDSPTSAKFLTGEEREVARARVVRQVGKTERKRGVVPKDMLATLLDLKAWITGLMYFSCNVSYASLPVFLPTILAEMGFTAVRAQGLSAPPYFASFLVTNFSAWYADHTQQRGLMISFLSLIGATGYVLLATCLKTGPKYLGVFLAACGVFPAIANILPWVLNNQGSDTRRGMGIVMLNLIGQCGPLLGTRVFPTSDAPRYVEGQWICAGFMFFNAFLAISLRTLLWYENKKLDQKYGTVSEAQQQAVRDGKVEQLATENYGAQFRYIL